MERIVLACCSGMSTSLLVNKMKAVANEMKLELEIYAVAQDQAPHELKDADVLLVGPQMRFIAGDLKTSGAVVGTPVDVIDMRAYGMANGKAVLQQAYKLKGETFPG